MKHRGIGKGGGVRALGLIAALAVGGTPLAAQNPPADSAQGRMVTLDEAIRLALEAQPAIIQAEGNVSIAHANQRVAVGNFLPSITANSSVSQNSSNRFNSATGQIVSAPPSTSYSGGLSASLTLFNGFARMAQSRAANASASSADATLTNQKFQIILQTKQAFFNALAAADLVKVGQTQVERSRRQLQVSKDKLAAGSAIRSDTLSATVDLGNAELQLLNATAQLATAEASLARLTGIEGVVHPTGQPAMPDLTALDTSALRQDAISASPTVQAADAQARSAGAQVAVARAQYFPSLNASLRQSWAGSQESSGVLPNPVNWPSPLNNTWSVSLGVSWPIFNGFAREAAMTQAGANRDAAEASAADARRQANAAFTQQLAALEAAAQQVTIGEASRAAAEENLRVQQERYRLGAATIVDVLTAQVSLGQAEVSLVQARLAVLTAKAQIEALVGREL